MYLQANVLIPKDFKKESKTRYPLMVFHGHFPKSIGGFRTSPPTASKKIPFTIVDLELRDINIYKKKRRMTFIKNGHPKISQGS